MCNNRLYSPYCLLTLSCNCLYLSNPLEGLQAFFFILNFFFSCKGDIKSCNLFSFFELLPGDRPKCAYFTEDSRFRSYIQYPVGTRHGRVPTRTMYLTYLESAVCAPLIWVTNSDIKSLILFCDRSRFILYIQKLIYFWLSFYLTGNRPYFPCIAIAHLPSL